MTQAASYMLIFRDTTPERYEGMSREELRENLDRWNGWCDALASEGRLVAGHPLHDAGRVVAAGKAPRPVDGPFAEAKELVGGYFLVNAADLDDATAIAGQCPLLGFGMTVEVRPVAGACHLARSLGWETMREPAEARA
jgi:hypothetical protein